MKPLSTIYKAAIRIMCGSVALLHVVKFMTLLDLLDHISGDNIPKNLGIIATLENAHLDIMN